MGLLIVACRASSKAISMFGSSLLAAGRSFHKHSLVCATLHQAHDPEMQAGGTTQMLDQFAA